MLKPGNEFIMDLLRCDNGSFNHCLHVGILCRGRMKQDVMMNRYVVTSSTQIGFNADSGMAEGDLEFIKSVERLVVFEIEMSDKTFAAEQGGITCSLRSQGEGKLLSLCEVRTCSGKVSSVYPRPSMANEFAV